MVRPVARFRNVVPMVLTAGFPFALIAAIPSAEPLQILFDWASQRVAAGLFPSGLGTVVAELTTKGDEWAALFDSTEWFTLTMQFAPIADDVDAEELLQLAVGADGLDPLNEGAADSSLSEVVRAPLDTLGMTQGGFATCLRSVESLLRLIGFVHPNLMRLMGANKSMHVPILLRNRVQPILSRLDNERARRMGKAAPENREQVDGQFHQEHPEFLAGLSLLKFVTTWTRGDGAPALLERLAKPAARVETTWSTSGGYAPSQFKFSLLPAPSEQPAQTPSADENKVDDPIAFIEDAGNWPAAARAAGVTSGSDYFDAMPDGAAIREAFRHTVSIEIGPATILWHDGLGVWPPSIDSFHVARYLSNHGQSFNGITSVTDVGAGTGVLGIFAALQWAKIKHVRFLESDYNSAVVCALNASLNLGGKESIQDTKERTTAVAVDVEQLLSGSPVELTDRTGKGRHVEIVIGNAMRTLRKQTSSLASDAHALVCAPPYIPNVQMLAPYLWRAVDGTDLLEFVIQHHHELADRVVVEFSSVALPHARRAYAACQTAEGAQEINTVGLGTVAFKIPPLAGFFASPADALKRTKSLVAVPERTKRFLESLTGITEQTTTVREGDREGKGYRFFHELYLADLSRRDR